MINDIFPYMGLKIYMYAIPGGRGFSVEVCLTLKSFFTYVFRSSFILTIVYLFKKKTTCNKCLGVLQVILSGLDMNDALHTPTYVPILWA